MAKRYLVFGGQHTEMAACHEAVAEYDTRSIATAHAVAYLQGKPRFHWATVFDTRENEIILRLRRKSYDNVAGGCAIIAGVAPE